MLLFSEETVGLGDPFLIDCLYLRSIRERMRTEKSTEACDAVRKKH